jgi:hypothetical protein
LVYLIVAMIKFSDRLWLGDGVRHIFFSIYTSDTLQVSAMQGFKLLQLLDVFFLVSSLFFTVSACELERGLPG